MSVHVCMCSIVPVLVIVFGLFLHVTCCRYCIVLCCTLQAFQLNMQTHVQYTDTPKETHTHTHAHTRTHTCTYTHPQHTHTYTYTHTHNHTHTQPHTHTHTLKQTHIHTHTIWARLNPVNVFPSGCTIS